MHPPRHSAGWIHYISDEIHFPAHPITLSLHSTPHHTTPHLATVFFVFGLPVPLESRMVEPEGQPQAQVMSPSTPHRPTPPYTNSAPPHLAKPPPTHLHSRSKFNGDLNSETKAWGDGSVIPGTLDTLACGDIFEQAIPIARTLLAERDAWLRILKLLLGCGGLLGPT